MKTLPSQMPPMDARETFKVRNRASISGQTVNIKIGLGNGMGAKKQKLNVNIDDRNTFTKYILLRQRPLESYKMTFRGKICRFLHEPTVTSILNGLLIIDLCILIASMQIELYYKDSQIDSFLLAGTEGAQSLDAYGDHGLHNAEIGCMWASVGILCIFLLELLLLMYGMGKEFFTKPMECADLVIVVISLYFELAKDSFAAAVLLLSRTWRFVRFMHGIFELDDDDSDSDDSDDDDEVTKERKKVIRDYKVATQKQQAAEKQQLVRSDERADTLENTAKTP
jgi:hypothetical protein